MRLSIMLIDIVVYIDVCEGTEVMRFGKRSTRMMAGNTGRGCCCMCTFREGGGVRDAVDE